MRLLACVLLLFILLPSTGAAQPASSAPSNVLLARGRTEPVVAVDPTHPSTIVVSSNTNYDAPVGGTYPTAYFASRDGGRRFTAGNVPIRWPYTTGADSTIAIARDGTVFDSYLGETPSYCSGGRSAVILTHSIDHGASFRTPSIVDANPADDKPNMAIESGHPSHLFLVWTRWHDHSSDIWYSRSANGGAGFSRPVMLYSSRLNNFGSVLLVGPHGHVYIFWSVFPDIGSGKVTPTQIFLRSSTDDGKHFGRARSIASFSGIPGMTQPGSLRNLTMPTAAVDGLGTVYLAWSRATTRLGGGSVDADIDLIRSTNGGGSWSSPVRVNDVRRGDRFMPAITALGNNSVGMAFYDRRNSRANLDLYAARVTYAGGVRVSTNVRVDRGTSPISDIFYIAPGSTCFAPGRFFGDYIGVARGSSSTLCVVWADTQLRVYNETDVWFARVDLPAPPQSRRMSRNRNVG